MGTMLTLALVGAGPIGIAIAEADEPIASPNGGRIADPDLFTCKLTASPEPGPGATMPDRGPLADSPLARPSWW
jgi:hypothetical protein